MALLDPIYIRLTRSDGEIKDFSGRPSYGEAFGITELVGFEFPEVEVFTAARGLGDGVFFTGQRLNGRTVEIHLKQNERYPQDFYDAWDNLKAFFNPGHTFQIRTAWDHDPTNPRYLGDCRILAADYHMINASEPNPELIVQMMSPDPFFTAIRHSDQVSYTDNVQLSYTYVGDYKARPYLTFVCTNAGDGTVLSFDVTMNGAQWSIGTPTAITVGDQITLDPETMGIGFNGPPDPNLVGTANAIYEAWWLNPGTNANKFIIDGNGCTFTFSVSCDPRYLGI